MWSLKIFYTTPTIINKRRLHIKINPNVLRSPQRTQRRLNRETHISVNTFVALTLEFPHGIIHGCMKLRLNSIYSVIVFYTHMTWEKIDLIYKRNNKKKTVIKRERSIEKKNYDSNLRASADIAMLYCEMSLFEIVFTVPPR